MRRANFRIALFQNEKRRWSKNETKLVLLLQGNIAPVRGTKLRNASIDTAPKFLSSAQDVGEELTSGPGRFISRKEPQYLLNRRTGRFRSRSGRFF